MAFKQGRRMKNSPSCAHVLHKTLNLVISRCCFAEDGKEMYKNIKRTCRAIGFAKPIVLWRSRCRPRRRCLSSLLWSLSTNVSFLGVVLLLTTDRKSSCFDVCGLTLQTRWRQNAPKGKNSISGCRPWLKKKKKRQCLSSLLPIPHMNKAICNKKGAKCSYCIAKILFVLYCN